MQIRHLSSERLSNISNNTQPVRAKWRSDPSLPVCRAGIFPLHQAQSPSRSHPSIHSFYSFLSRSNWKSFLSVGISWVDQTHERSGCTHVRVIRCSSSLYIPQRVNPLILCHVFPPWEFTGASSVYLRQWHHHPFSASPSRSLLQLPQLYRWPESWLCQVSRLEGPLESVQDDTKIHRGQGACLSSTVTQWQDQD